MLRELGAVAKVADRVRLEDAGRVLSVDAVLLVELPHLDHASDPPRSATYRPDKQRRQQRLDSIQGNMPPVQGAGRSAPRYLRWNAIG